MTAPQRCALCGAYAVSTVAKLHPSNPEKITRAIRLCAPHTVEVTAANAPGTVRVSPIMEGVTR